jgi:hypothetical protein
MLKALLATTILTISIVSSASADDTPNTMQNPYAYSGYPTAVLEGSRADGDDTITQVIFTIMPKMIVSLSADSRQLHIELTDDATKKFASLIASHKGQMVSVQAPTGKEIVTAKSTGKIRGRYILSHEFDNKTELQTLYKSLKTYSGPVESDNLL